jgi:hypothetical protein
MAGVEGVPQKMIDDALKKETDSSQSVNSESDIIEDFATAPGIPRRERLAFRRLSDVLRFTDFMTFMMVVATAFSAFATWRSARVTSLLFAVAERPYMGVEQVTMALDDAQFARVVVDCRNFGQVQATGGVAQVGVMIDGKPLPHSSAAANTENIGIISPTVPHRIFRFVPKAVYEDVRNGVSRMVVHVKFNFRGPDDRQFCYSKLYSYDTRSADFIPAGGSEQCDGEIY